MRRVPAFMTYLLSALSGAFFMAGITVLCGGKQA